MSITAMVRVSKQGGTEMTYETPVGTFATWEAAAAACERADMDACSCIINRPDPSPDTFTTCLETAYGSTQRLSFQVKVF